MKEINLIGRESRCSYVWLVKNSFELKGWKVNHADWTRGLADYPILNPDAPTLVMRGDDQIVPLLLANLKGKRVLWFQEDLCRNEGEELFRLVPFYDEVYTHVLPDRFHEILKNIFPRQKFGFIPMWYLDLSIFNNTNQKRTIDVLHYGVKTPRREFYLNELRKSGVSIVEVGMGDWWEIARRLNQSKIVLNLHAYTPVNTEVRFTEAAACGTFVVSESIWDLNDMPAGYFEATATAIVKSDNMDEMRSSIDYFLSHYSDLKEKSQSASAFAKKHFNHLKMADDIINKLEIR